MSNDYLDGPGRAIGDPQFDPTAVTQEARDADRLAYLEKQIGEWDMANAVEVIEMAKRYLKAAQEKARNE